VRTGRCVEDRVKSLRGAAFAELWSAQHGIRIPMPEVRYWVLLGAASAVVAASLGWIHRQVGMVPDRRILSGG
jgi:hypothetical protein